MTLFELNLRERAALEALTLRTDNAKLLRRAQALLWLDDGEAAQEAAERLSVSRQSVYNWATRFQLRNGLDIARRVADGLRSGRPPTAYGIIDPLISEMIDLDPRELGYRSTVWTAPLLAQYLLKEHSIKVCSDSVSLALRRLRIRWKRPRHHLALRPSTWRQAKGG
jgi:transposase